MAKRTRPLRFIDLFAGIGGTRLAFEAAGGRCVFSSEWDRFAQQTYQANFGIVPHGDIRSISSEDIPPHDILVAGFPCQPFSISGVSKKRSLNRPDGFDDPTQGTLFFEIKRIIRDKRPRAFLLENVKNLRNHDGGRTYRVIEDSLRHELGYDLYADVIDADGYVPQHRERIFIVGFKKKQRIPFVFPQANGPKPRLRDILDLDPQPKYTLTDHLWKYLQDYAAKHKRQGNGFGFGLADLDGRSRTLSARYYKDGSEILIPQNGKNPRRLTPSECVRLMGFDQLRPNFKMPVSDTQAYRQLGNSVVVPLVAEVASAIVHRLRPAGEQEDLAAVYERLRARLRKTSRRPTKSSRVVDLFVDRLSTPA